MSANIILTGIMGCGKTSVGKAISKVLKDYTFVDVDDVIVDIEGMSITEIFEKKSEKYFRELEEKIIEELSEEEDLIISLGGGAFESEVNRKNLSENGTVFYLKASIDTLFERIKDDTSRPLLKCDNPRGKLKELLEKRESNYLKADYIIETDGLKVADIIEKIINIIETSEKWKMES